MRYQNKTSKELIKEISILNQQITKLKEFKDKNKQELIEIKTLLDKLPQAVYEIDKKGNFTFLNQTAMETWGFTENELKNDLPSLQTLIPEDRPRAINNNINKLLSGKKLKEKICISQARKCIKIKKDSYFKINMNRKHYFLM